MPQVFSAGWLYLFIIVIVISLVRIYLKIRTIQSEGPLDRPVIKVAPVPRTERELDAPPDGDPRLNAPDDLVRNGDYGAALELLDQLLEELSPTEDRETRGDVFFRKAACHTRLATGGERLRHLLRSGEALGEAVRLFSPVRFRSKYLRALGELASLHEDLALEKNPVENLTQTARICETAAASAREGDAVVPMARFLARSGSAYRRLATHGEPQVNLRKAVDAYEKAAVALATVEGESAADERMKLLKVLGDTYVDLAQYYQKGESLTHATTVYQDALDLMDETVHSQARCIVLADTGRVLLERYDIEQSPAHLRQAIRHLRDALELARGEEMLIPRGLALAAMGDALTLYADTRDRKENLERAVKFYETALGIIKDGERPMERERIKERLAEAVRKLGAQSG